MFRQAVGHKKEGAGLTPIASPSRIVACLYDNCTRENIRSAEEPI